jgi:hypothetical protein
MQKLNVIVLNKLNMNQYTARQILLSIKPSYVRHTHNWVIVIMVKSVDLLMGNMN